MFSFPGAGTAPSPAGGDSVTLPVVPLPEVSLPVFGIALRHIYVDTLPTPAEMRAHAVPLLLEVSPPACHRAPRHTPIHSPPYGAGE